MRNPVSDVRYEELVSWSEGQELPAFWAYLRADFVDFGDRREAFLWILRRLLEEQRVELVNLQTHEALAGTIDQQIIRFKAAFPKNEEEMNNGIWFFTEACPGGAAWRPSATVNSSG